MPQIGDIGFVSGYSPMDILIEYFDKGKFNHVFIFLDENVETGNQRIIESQYFVNTRIIDNPYKESELTVLSMNLTDEQKQKLLQIAPTYLKDKYDLLQILGIFLHDILGVPTNITWNNKHKMICSELVVNLLYSVGYISDEDYKTLINTTPNLLFTYLYNRLTKSA
jgi:hypothetical protein